MFRFTDKPHNQHTWTLNSGHDEPRKNELRLNLSLDESNSLKGIALILLLIHHLFYIDNGRFDDLQFMGHGVANTLGILCKVCVSLFVFLSGYGLGLTISRTKKLDVGKFYIRRFTKLFLNYWFIWILFVPVGILFFNRSFSDVYGEDGWLYAILDFWGLINMTGRYGYNPTWWFYSCIILLYILFPLISYLVSRWPKTIWIILLASVVIIKLPFTFIAPIRYYFFPFVLGIILSNKLIINILPPPHSLFKVHEFNVQWEFADWRSNDNADVANHRFPYTSLHTIRHALG